MLKYILYFTKKTERPNTVNIYAEPEQDLFLRDDRLKGWLGDVTSRVVVLDRKLNPKIFLKVQHLTIK